MYLDEIGELGVPIQIKLLQVLQERSFTSLGDHALKRFKGRVIGATNLPLDQLRAEGRFRDDLYYRLCSDIIVVPPLRERLREAPAELEQLVAILTERLTGERNAAMIDEVLAVLAACRTCEKMARHNAQKITQRDGRAVYGCKRAKIAQLLGNSARFSQSPTGS